MAQVFRYLLLVALFIAPLLTYAQPGPPAGGGPPCGPPFGPVCPIDGGATFLLAAGVLYGSKKIHDLRKKNLGR
ncbi:MAG: hypothetical protein JNM00_00070 [Flavobacteriales bacterium]|nr:hypothetical protein [Flavobacteriales bacterium]